MRVLELQFVLIKILMEIAKDICWFKKKWASKLVEKILIQEQNNS